MNVLVLNCGSSSLKYKLIEMPSERELAGGEAQGVGPPTAKPPRLLHHADGKRVVREVEMPDHGRAFQEVMSVLLEESGKEPEALGHRLVHGGRLFSDPVVIDAQVLAALESINHLAPLHNPPAVGLIAACRKLYPQIPQVAVFDTAYHSTIPDYASRYALPGELVDRLGLRKYGFHGTSHRYVAGEAARFLKKPLERLNAVSCHLGSGGASLCAIAGGKSVDNTMGYSPLQGLVMSTRCGDLDPAVVLQLLYQAEGGVKNLEKLLNKKSGVLGLSGDSAEIRDVFAALQSPEEPGSRKSLTAEVYLWRLRKYLGAYLAIADPADAVIFTDSIGETMPQVRWAVCADMEPFGLSLDSARNENPGNLPTDISSPDSRVRILVVRTNEELAIARGVRETLDGNGGGK